jgi:predicted enzyme related to lactoylglutathione lyase
MVERKGLGMTQNRTASWSAAIVAATAIAALAMAMPAQAQQAELAPGSFLGAVLVSDDAPAARAFYADLFGRDMEQAKDGGYAVRHKGHMIAGISPIREKDEEIDESTWLVGLVVEDIDRSLDVAAREKATIHEEVDRVSDYGRFAVVADRQGAPLLLIEPGRKPLGQGKEQGSWVWTELWTDDIEDAAAFYAKVIGVGHDTVDRGAQKYHVFTARDAPRAGIIKIPAELEDVEPGWAPYVAVSDIAASLAKVKKLGGRVVFGETEHPSTGSVALIVDPSGAALFIYQIGSSEEAK